MSYISCHKIKGINPFSGGDFYLWIDLDEICTVASYM